MDSRWWVGGRGRAHHIHTILTLIGGPFMDIIKTSFLLPRRKNRNTQQKKSSSGGVPSTSPNTTHPGSRRTTSSIISLNERIPNQKIVPTPIFYGESIDAVGGSWYLMRSYVYRRCSTSAASFLSMTSIEHMRLEACSVTVQWAINSNDRNIFEFSPLSR